MNAGRRPIRIFGCPAAASGGRTSRGAAVPTMAQRPPAATSRDTMDDLYDTISLRWGDVLLALASVCVVGFIFAFT